MSVQILSRRSSVLRDRPFPTRLGDGELAINTNVGEPGLFFKDSGSGLIKAGPTFVGLLRRTHLVSALQAAVKASLGLIQQVHIYSKSMTAPVFKP